MASNNPVKEVVLTSPLDWDIQDEIFKIKAQINDLQAYINLNINREKLFKKPIKSKLLDFPKYTQSNC